MANLLTSSPLKLGPLNRLSGGWVGVRVGGCDEFSHTKLFTPPT